MAEGYDHSQLQQGLIDGESNYVVFVSNTTREHLYFYYTPLAINQWRVALSVPEDLVFAGARNIRGLLNLILILEGAAFLIYIAWMVYYIRRETGEKQRQLDALSYIYDVEKLLFNAHEHRENVTQSLSVIARMLPARRVAFTMLSGERAELGCLWEEGGESVLGSALLENAPAMAAQFASGKTGALRRYRPGGPGHSAGCAGGDGRSGGCSGGGRRRCAPGGAVGQRPVPPAGCAAMLKSVGFSFALLCGNTRTYYTYIYWGSRMPSRGCITATGMSRICPVSPRRAGRGCAASISTPTACTS